MIVLSDETFRGSHYDFWYQTRQILYRLSVFFFNSPSTWPLESPRFCSVYKVSSAEVVEQCIVPYDCGYSTIHTIGNYGMLQFDIF